MLGRLSAGNPAVIAKARALLEPALRRRGRHVSAVAEAAAQHALCREHKPASELFQKAEALQAEEGAEGPADLLELTCSALLSHLRAGRLSEEAARDRLTRAEAAAPRGAPEPAALSLARVAVAQRFGRAAPRDVEAELDAAVERHCATFRDVPYGAHAQRSIRSFFARITDLLSSPRGGRTRRASPAPPPALPQGWSWQRRSTRRC